MSTIKLSENEYEIRFRDLYEYADYLYKYALYLYEYADYLYKDEDFDEIAEE